MNKAMMLERSLAPGQSISVLVAKERCRKRKAQDLLDVTVTRGIDDLQPTPWALEKLNETRERVVKFGASNFEFEWLDDAHVQVTFLGYSKRTHYVVEPQRGLCTCGKPRTTGLPCLHVVAAAMMAPRRTFSSRFRSTPERSRRSDAESRVVFPSLRFTIGRWRQQLQLWQVDNDGLLIGSDADGGDDDGGDDDGGDDGKKTLKPCPLFPPKAGRPRHSERLLSAKEMLAPRRYRKNRQRDASHGAVSRSEEDDERDEDDLEEEALQASSRPQGDRKPRIYSCSACPESLQPEQRRHKAYSLKCPLRGKGDQEHRAPVGSTTTLSATASRS